MSELATRRCATLIRANICAELDDGDSELIVADGYPIEDATEVAIETTKDFLEKDDKVS